MTDSRYAHECDLSPLWPPPTRGHYMDSFLCLFPGHKVSFVWGHSRCDGLPRCMHCGTPMPEEIRS